MIETAKYIFTHYVLGLIGAIVIYKIIVKEVKRELRLQGRWHDEDEEDD